MLRSVWLEGRWPHGGAQWRKGQERLSNGLGRADTSRRTPNCLWAGPLPQSTGEILKGFKDLSHNGSLLLKEVSGPAPRIIGGARSEAGDSRASSVTPSSEPIVRPGSFQRRLSVEIKADGVEGTWTLPWWGRGWTEFGAERRGQTGVWHRPGCQKQRLA